MPQTIARCFAVGILLVLPKMAQAESPCPPDGDDSNWPTYEITDKCGDYDQCAALVESGRLQEAQACNQKIDNCGVNLFRSNKRADAHNAALEVCRSSIWKTVIKPAENEKTGR
jgi:hypothetical protein